MNDKDLAKLAKKALPYLENYASDLTFQLSHGSEFVNYCTDSTPEFDEDHEAREYIDELESLIDKLTPRYKYTVDVALDVSIPVTVTAKHPREAIEKAVEELRKQNSKAKVREDKWYDHKVTEVQDIEEDSK